MSPAKKIIVLGGGFAGVACVQNLIRLGLDQTHHITLISSESHFAYHAVLYRLVTGGSDTEACIPLSVLIRSPKVTIVIDAIHQIEPPSNTLTGESGRKYSYDYLVIAVGSVTSYFDIPGLASHAFSFKDFASAKALNRHLHLTIAKAKTFKTRQAQASTARISVVGGGASGVELAAQLALYLPLLAHHHHFDQNLIHIDLIHSNGRLLNDLPARLSLKVYQRLIYLGINPILNHRVVKEDFNTIFLGDNSLQSKTLVWTAGTTLPPVLANSSLPKNARGRLITNAYLQVPGHQNIFVAGDNTTTIHSGMAQTALHHGKLIAKNLASLINHQPLTIVRDPTPIYAIPLGNRWAATKIGRVILYGYAGWVVRRLLDLKVFLTLLPPLKAWQCYLGGFKHMENCPTCKS